MKAQDRKDRSVRDDRGEKKDRCDQGRKRERETAGWDVQKFCQRHPDGSFPVKFTLDSH